MKHPRTPLHQGFTLVELLTVIAIIAVLMGLLFPAVNAVKETGRKTQAKNDLIQIVNACKAYQAEYSKLPARNARQGTADSDEYGDDNDQLFNVLRGIANAGEQLEMNPKRIPFIDIPLAKGEQGQQRGGLGTEGSSSGKYLDPWGIPYFIRLDSNYNNEIPNPYTSGAGFATVNAAAIAWSTGKDKRGGSGAFGSNLAADDITSWR